MNAIASLAVYGLVMGVLMLVTAQPQSFFDTLPLAGFWLWSMLPMTLALKLTLKRNHSSKFFRLYLTFTGVSIVLYMGVIFFAKDALESGLSFIIVPGLQLIFIITIKIISLIWFQWCKKIEKNKARDLS